MKGIGRRWNHCFIKKNCWQQDIERRERWEVFGKVLLFLIASGYFYYRSFWAIPFLSPVGIWFYKEYIEEVEKKKKEEFIRQFQDFLQILQGSLVAGYSLENSMKEAERELVLLYPKEVRLRKEVRYMNHQLKIQISMEQIWTEFSKRVEVEEVQLFTAVFLAGKKSGGNLVEIIGETVQQISEKIEVMREIALVMAGKRYELTIMKWMPFGILFYITVSFPEFIKGLYGNVLGRGVMTLCFVLYLVAGYWGRKILSIEV